jgi:hypothetical protein
MDVAELLIREGVRDTVARYNWSGDRGDLVALAACFVADGVLAVAGREPFVGRDGIVDGLTRTLRPDPVDDRAPVGYVHHSVTTLHFIEVSPSEVTTSCYFSVLTRIGLDHWGRYRDRLVPVGGQWLFARREVTVSGHGPGSLFERGDR